MYHLGAPDSKQRGGVPHLLIVQTLVAIATLLLSGCAQPTRTATPVVSPPIASPTHLPTSTPRPTSSPTPTLVPTPTPTPGLTLFEKFAAFPWVAYAPTHYDPVSGMMPTVEEIAEDMRVLYEAGFRGIVTYGASDVLAEIPHLAREAGFEGVVMGIWMPGDPEETQAAIQAMSDVDGYVVGNEGLFFDRYEFDALEQAIAELREETGKPVATSEVLSLYYTDERLLGLGDWVFPNAHPYWQGVTEPIEALTWTQDTFDGLKAMAGDVSVILKEVGLPTAGAPGLSEYQQAEYYARLRESPVGFVYFEAFDQPWKSEDGIGPHWGLFHSDRSLKVASGYVERGYPPFYVYADAGAPHNHFVPEGWMGCWRGIEVDQNDQSSPFSGASSIRITYVPKSGCERWAGIYWWDPPGSDWCKEPGGFELRGWTTLTFWARGERGGEVAEFKVGGLKNAVGDPCDSLRPAKTTHPLVLSTEWTQYSISLYGRDLSHIAGGFVWVTDADQETTIYLDEIRFEWSEGR